ncbi:MAG: hypothetical protein ACRDLY_16360, partial [Thermoleophilaceae bacterium]
MSSAVLYMSMSLDGFIAGPDDDADNPLGIDGHRLTASCTELSLPRPAPRAWNARRLLGQSEMPAPGRQRASQLR